MGDPGRATVGCPDGPLPGPVDADSETRICDGCLPDMSATATSAVPLPSPGSRSVASVRNPTYFPVSFDDGWSEGPLPALPFASADTSAVCVFSVRAWSRFLNVTL